MRQGMAGRLVAGKARAVQASARWWLALMVPLAGCAPSGLDDSQQTGGAGQVAPSDASTAGDVSAGPDVATKPDIPAKPGASADSAGSGQADSHGGPAPDTGSAVDSAASPADSSPADSGPATPPPDAQTPPATPCETADDCPIATSPCAPKACLGGVCAYPAAPDGTSCSDGDPCTADDVCVAGQCKGQEGLGTSVLTAWSKGGFAWAMTALPGGGYALAGEATPTTGGPTDAWLAVADSNGTFSWQAGFGGSGAESARALQRLDDGGFLLAGSIGSKGAGGLDGWLVRTDGKGQPLWDTAWGGKADDTFLGVTVLGNGKLVAVGQTHSQGQGQGDAWIVGFSSTGAVLWEQVYGNPGDDAASAVTATPDGGFLAVGWMTPPTGVLALPDVWVMKATAGGKVEWQKTFGTKAEDRASAVVQVQGGGFAVLGETGESKTYGNKTDFWLLRVDAAGTLLWDRTYGGSEGERGYGLAQLADGGFALAGYTGTYGVGLWSSWLVRTDADGWLAWQQAYGTPEMDRAQAVVALPGGGMALAGQVHDAKTGVDAALLVRVDRWGSATCTQDGKCSGLTLADCDDGNACTTDLCSNDAPMGCVHAVVQNGTNCGQDLMCAKGACK